MNKVKLLHLALSCGLGLGLAACGATVRPGTVGLKYRALRNPAMTSKVYGPGYYPLWTWNNMIVYDATSQNRDEDIHTLTRDTLHVPTTVTVTFRIRADEVYQLHTEVGPDYYQKLIGPSFITIVRSEFALHNHNDLAAESPLIEARVAEQLRKLMGGYHIEIERIAIKHIDYDNMVTDAISRKIAVLQQSQQKIYEMEIAGRDAEIARTAARGRSDAVRIEAEGAAAAILARGKAQAEAQDAIAKTLTPKYLQYKAFENPAATYYFIPTGKDGLPIMITPTAPGPRPAAR